MFWKTLKYSLPHTVPSSSSAFCKVNKKKKFGDVTVQFVGLKTSEVSVTRRKLVQCGGWLHTSVTEHAICVKLPTFSLTGAYCLLRSLRGFLCMNAGLIEPETWASVTSELTEQEDAKECVCVCVCVCVSEWGDVGVRLLFPAACNHSHRRRYLSN